MAAEPTEVQAPLPANRPTDAATGATPSESDYEAREANAPAELAGFQGGDGVVVIGGTTLVIILLVVLIIILL